MNSKEEIIECGLIYCKNNFDKKCQLEKPFLLPNNFGSLISCYDYKRDIAKIVIK